MAVHKIDGVDGVNHFPKKFVTLTATAAITKGNVVMIDTGTTTNGAGMHVKKTDAADDQLQIGVAAETVTASGAAIKIQVAGYNGDCTDSGSAIAAGLLVGCDTAGLVEIVSDQTATTKYFAVCVDAFTAGAADVAIMIVDHGFYG